MSDQIRYVAKTLQGLETVLADELVALGAEGVEKGTRSVTFLGDQRMLYRANFFLRTALRILKPLFSFKASSSDELYGQAMAYDWSEVLDLSKRFAVSSVVNSEVFTHSHFAALRVKDAIVDQFRGQFGRRPFVDPNKPDIRIHLHIYGTTCTVLLDSSGESLHMRGYRKEQEYAPISEVLAAGMILMTGWKGESPFLDPLCGSGTLAIEAAMIANGIAPGLFRKKFGFESWKDFDADLFAEIYNDDSLERNSDALIVANDISQRAIDATRINAKTAGIAQKITVLKESVFDLRPPLIPGVVVTNPPYGERVKQANLEAFYQQLGDRFKSSYAGWDVWMISGNREAMRSFGLHPSKTVTLFNGSLECKYQKFAMYKGSLRDLPSSPSDDDSEPEIVM